ncbi:16S rRNA (uracil(1498)-N(3))-methyltransferase [Actinotalea sp. M2MS4P-6]|uniref:16S rRNA (uracil(1498)-N(3))-methyltransferase n=1 Tax=Actinotalea sp. M2MS4P-6 TaxID=2983762 RepID=UPI0021E39CD4|nr:16S rRNA (uracil(1498)-N(3))-methyltransferase [Actinotalea sp. M2MS4P-6]MCV2393931.1 16S rRNA (uracil(1498)-N(3))-methyltransferase [Actinotalea sp. M2MS4P-6]
MTAPVFLAEPGVLDGLEPGARYVLEGAEARHAGVVQRRRPGEAVDVVDGAGVRLCCTIADVEPGRLVLQVAERVVEARPAVRVVLVQALAKGDRDELAIEAATEVGVDGIVPWQAQRSIVVWRGDRAARSRAKWLATVRSATKQSRRAAVPEVAEAVTTAGLAALTAQVVGDGGAVLVLHESATTPLRDAALPDAGDVLLVVGPEGGIDDDELAALTGAGAVAVRLGPHVLRTSTAGPVAAALVAERLGRWGGAPRAGAH